MAEPATFVPTAPDDRSELSARDQAPRNSLRYVLTPREQQLLYRKLLARSKTLQTRAGPEGQSPGEDDYNAASLRISLRLFVASYSGLKLWEKLSERLFSRGKER